MSGALQSHDIAGSLAAPTFGQALDVSLRLVALDHLHRPLVQLKPVREVFNGADTGVDEADFAGNGHSVDRGDDAVCDRAEALVALGHQLCSFSHSVPRDSAPMCGAEQRTSRSARSIGKPQALRGIFQQSNTNSRGIHSPGPHRADRRQSNVPHRALAALFSSTA